MRTTQRPPEPEPGDRSVATALTHAWLTTLEQYKGFAERAIAQVGDDWDWATIPPGASASFNKPMHKRFDQR